MRDLLPCWGDSRCFEGSLFSKAADLGADPGESRWCAGDAGTDRALRWVAELLTSSGGCGCWDWTSGCPGTDVCRDSESTDSRRESESGASPGLARARLYLFVDQARKDLAHALPCAGAGEG